jgi:hypothetical protein
VRLIERVSIATFRCSTRALYRVTLVGLFATCSIVSLPKHIQNSLTLVESHQIIVVLANHASPSPSVTHIHQPAHPFGHSFASAPLSAHRDRNYEDDWYIATTTNVLLFPISHIQAVEAQRSLGHLLPRHTRHPERCECKERLCPWPAFIRAHSPINPCTCMLW